MISEERILIFYDCGTLLYITKDMIAAILGIITRDSDIIDAFKQAPGRLVNGMIVLKPAERVSWKGLEEKMRASEQFLHSL